MRGKDEFVSPEIDPDRELMTRDVIIAQGNDDFHYLTDPDDTLKVIGGSYKDEVGSAVETPPMACKVRCDICGQPMTMAKRGDALAIFCCTSCDQEFYVKPNGNSQCLILKYLFPFELDPLSKQYQSYLDYYLERAGFIMDCLKAAGWMSAATAFYEWEKALLYVKHKRELIEQQRVRASNRHKWIIAGLAGLVVWTVLILVTLWVVGLFRL